MNVLAKSTGKPSKEHSDGIIMLMRVMLADYPAQYRKSYPDRKSAMALKTRLESKLSDFEVKDIINGYEALTEQSSEFMPTIPALVESIGEAKRLREKKERGEDEAKKIAELPAEKSVINCDPMAMLSDAQASVKSNGLTTDDRMHELRLDYNRAIASAPTRYADNVHLCCVNGCNKAGSLSSSTRGSETWYCREHFSLI